jgi:MFS superfamily sulfate permease-like transporter
VSYNCLRSIFNGLNRYGIHIYIYIYIFIWKNYPFTTVATTTGVAVAASKICLHIIKLYTVHTKNNIYSVLFLSFFIFYFYFWSWCRTYPLQLKPPYVFFFVYIGYGLNALLNMPLLTMTYLNNMERMLKS